MQDNFRRFIFALAIFAAALLVFTAIRNWQEDRVTVKELLHRSNECLS